MGRTVQARLDSETDRLLSELRRKTGLSDSALLRKGIQALSRETTAVRRPRIVGLGKFSSGCPDLGSNPEHLRGFGRS